MVNIILLISLIGLWVGIIGNINWLTISALLLNSIIIIINMIAGKDK